MSNNVRTASGGRAAQTKPKGFAERLQQTINEIADIVGDRSRRFDVTLFVLIIALLATGLVMMYSASYAYSYQYEGNSNYYVLKQLLFSGIGIVFMLLISFYPARRIKRATLLIYAISLFLLILVLLLPKIEGVHRWIDLGFTTFQPSELAKFAVILFSASWCDSNAERISKPQWGILPFVIMLAPILGLLVLEPHISCIIVILLLTFTMMFIGGSNLKWAAIIGAVLALGVGVLIFSGVVSYSSARIAVWVDPFVDIDKGWQNIQALYAISSGGLFGQGLGNSNQKYLYIPEPQNDFVFAVVCEELGFIGAVLILLLFFALIWRGITVSLANPNHFCKLLGIGITSQVAWQMLLNIAVVTKTLPNTGISLPFFSYGGTSLVMLLAEMGVLLGISRDSTIRRI